MADFEHKLQRLCDTLIEVQLGLEAIRSNLDGYVKAQEDHEQRLRELERWHQRMTPLFAVATFALGALFKIGLEKLL